MINQFIELTAKLNSIAREIGSPFMEEKILRMSESFYKRLSKDKNLPKGRDIEAEMDDKSGEEEEGDHENN